MIKSLKTELQKLKYRRLPLLLLGFLMLVFFWLLVTLLGNKSVSLSDGYFSVLYQLPIMNTLLMPLFIAVLASRIWDIEHKGNSLKLLCTLQKREYLYDAKSLIGIFLCFVVSLGECLLLPLLGRLLHFTQTFPAIHVLLLLITTFITSIFLYFLQEIISFLFENQVVALAAGLIGSFFGLFSIFFARGFQQFVLWSYYSLLQTIGMNWDSTTRDISYTEVPLSLSHLLLLCLFTLLLAVAGKKLFHRKEI